MKKIFIVALALASFSISSVYAEVGFIAKGVTLTKVTSTTDSGGNAFWVLAEGGTLNNCGSSTAIRFRTTSVADPVSIDRAYAMALSAYLANKPVNIYSYIDTEDCDAASTMEFY